MNEKGTPTRNVQLNFVNVHTQRANMRMSREAYPSVAGLDFSAD
jgi:hypothetical protein